MSGSFASASSQRLRNNAPPLVSTGFPLTVAMWVRPAGTGAARSFWSYCDTAGSQNYFSLGHTSGNIFSIRVASSVGSVDATALTAVNGLWTFIVGRFISATNRRLFGLRQGVIGNAQDVTNRSPVGLDTMAVGCREHSAPTEFWDGQVAEFWYTATDIQPDGGQLDSALARQLAYGGPFSVPHIAKDVLEYRSLRKDVLAGDGRDIIVGAGAGMQAWGNVNAATLGPHPSLPYWYVNPRQTRRVLPI